MICSFDEKFTFFVLNYIGSSLVRLAASVCWKPLWWYLFSFLSPPTCTNLVCYPLFPCLHILHVFWPVKRPIYLLHFFSFFHVNLKCRRWPKFFWFFLSYPALSSCFFRVCLPCYQRVCWSHPPTSYGTKSSSSDDFNHIGNSLVLQFV